MAQNRIRAVTQIQSNGFASGGDIFTDKEDHSTECNGILQTFSLLNESFPGSEHVFWRGLLRRQCDTAYPVPPTNAGEYWLDNLSTPGTTKIIMVVAPDTGDDLVVSYRKKFVD